MSRRAFLASIPAAAIILASITFRLPQFGAPFMFHEFRQTQTAITVQAFLDRGLSVLHYETPVLGSPWQAPFELPTFQITAYAIAKFGVPLDVACRMAALGWFYLSALLLYLLVKQWTSAKLATLSLAAYVLTPFAIVWSRAALIDYASVALSLAYVLSTSSWVRSGGRRALVGAAVAGSLAYTTKITTVAAYLPAVALLLLFAQDVRAARAAGRNERRPSVRSFLLGAAIIVAIPLVAGLAWTAWADHVKAASPATAWLTSKNLWPWSFGTWEQRKSLANWVAIGERITEYVYPGFAALVVPAGLIFAVRRRGAAGIALLAAAVGVVGTFAAFFNLHRIHDYYLIAVTAPLAVLAAAGLLEVMTLFRLPPAAAALVTAIGFGLAAWYAPSHYRFLWYVNQVYKTPEEHPDLPLMRLARRIQEITPPDSSVVIEGDDWNPRILYWAHRRGFMLNPQDTVAMMPKDDWRALACKSCPQELLALWPARRRVGQEGDFQLFALTTDATHQ